MKPRRDRPGRGRFPRGGAGFRQAGPKTALDARAGRMIGQPALVGAVERPPISTEAAVAMAAIDIAMLVDLQEHARMAQRSGQVAGRCRRRRRGRGGADGLGQGRGQLVADSKGGSVPQRVRGIPFFFATLAYPGPCIRILPRHDEPVRHRSARPQASRAADRSAVGRGDVGDHAGGNSLRPSGGPGRMDYSDLGGTSTAILLVALLLCDAALGSRQAIAAIAIPVGLAVLIGTAALQMAVDYGGQFAAHEFLPTRIPGSFRPVRCSSSPPSI